MTTPNGWQGQNNPAHPQQAPSSASAHHPAGPAGYGAPAPGQGAPGAPQGYGQPGAQYAQPKPKNPADTRKIFNLAGLIALGVALVLVILGLIFTLTGTSSHSEEDYDQTYVEVKKLYYVGQTFLSTGIGVAVVGAAAYVGSLIQGLTAQLKK